MTTRFRTTILSSGKTATAIEVPPRLSSSSGRPVGETQRSHLAGVPLRSIISAHDLLDHDGSAGHLGSPYLRARAAAEKAHIPGSSQLGA